MTKKHYVKLADILRAHMNRARNADLAHPCDYSPEVADHIGSVIEDIADFLALDNPRFDRAKFSEACGVLE